MNIPNSLTTLRVLFIPLLIFFLLSRFEGKEILAFFVFLTAATTDMLDGFWARKKKQTSPLGQLLDPIADKLLVSSAFICLVELGAVSSWMVIIIVGRELSISGFRAIASAKGISIPPSFLGKLKMNVETVTICLLILGKKYMGRFYFLAHLGLWLVIVTAILSAAEYYKKFGPRILSKSS